MTDFSWAVFTFLLNSDSGGSSTWSLRFWGSQGVYGLTLVARSVKILRRENYHMASEEPRPWGFTFMFPFVNFSQHLPKLNYTVTYFFQVDICLYTAWRGWSRSRHEFKSLNAERFKVNQSHCNVTCCHCNKSGDQLPFKCRCSHACIQT